MGVLLLVVSALAGYCFCKQFSDSDRPVVSIFGSIVVGCLLSGTTLYFLDLAFVHLVGDFGNASLLYLGVASLYIFYAYKRLSILERAKADAVGLLQDRTAVGCAVLFLIFSAWLNWHTLNLTSHGNILVANGAWSDLMYHVSYVRSVALGNNIPIQYPYFANEPVRYHFMFDYFAGKLSQFGLDSVQALNVMSTLGLVSLLMLVVEFGRFVFRSTLSGFLGALFLIFHGSLSIFPWLRENASKNLLQKMAQQSEWLSGAPFEVWGLFNLNVFLNQRHFAFGLAILVLLVVSLTKFTEESEPTTGIDLRSLLKDRRNVRFLVFWSLVVGCLPFWNALFAAVALLFMLAFAILNYRNRGVFLVLLLSMAVSSVVVYPQLMMFRSGDSALGGYPHLHLGYALEAPSLLGFVAYYLRVVGLKWLLAIVALFLVTHKLRLYLFIFLVPFLIANVLQLSQVLYDNNKLIIVSLVFLNVYAAYPIAVLIRRGRAMIVVALLLTLSVTLAGVVDLFAVKNLKQAELADRSSSLKWWVVYNTEPRSVFLTNVFIPYADNAISSVNLAGRYLYVVSNCVSSSCFVDGRIGVAKKIYSFEGGLDRVRSLLQQERIDYVLIDEHVRNNTQLALNERAFIENLTQAYKDESVSIYKLTK
jgi:hypothetical protein